MAIVAYVIHYIDLFSTFLIFFSPLLFVFAFLNGKEEERQRNLKFEQIEVPKLETKESRKKGLPLQRKNEQQKMQ